MDTVGRYEIKPFIKYRKVVADTVELASKKHQMKGNMEIDVTLAREKLRRYKERTGEPQSFTAWFVKCVAQAVSENREIHGMRKGRKIILFEDVDILILVETTMSENQVALPYVVRQADRKSCREIHTEIRAAQKHTVQDSAVMIGRELSFMKLYPDIPKTLRMLVGRIITANPFRVKARTGTVSVSAIGMMGKVNGWISPISPLPLSFAVCSITKKPGVVEGRIEIREVLNIAFAADHDLIDGAQLVRFLARLNDLLEQGFDLELLDQPVG